MMTGLGATIEEPGAWPAAGVSGVPRAMIIAIDGPAAAGKGTLAARLAAHFGLPYLDTGLLYRAVGKRVADAGRDPDDPAAAGEAAAALEPDELANPALRGHDAGELASRVAVHPRSVARCSPSSAISHDAPAGPSSTGATSAPPSCPMPT